MEKPALEEPLAGEEVDVKLNEDLKVIIDFSEYKPWSGAVDTYELIKDADKLDELEAYLEECYPDGVTATQINDILWFDSDQVLSYLGLGDVEDEEVDESLQEAKKDDELPVDPEAAKLEVHTMLNDLVADEIEAINGYEDAKKEILDAPISHKDTILDTVDHIEDEEKEHVDELISATTEIPFDKEEASVPVVEEPLDQEFPEVEEALKEAAPDTPFDSDVKEGDKIRIIHLEGEDNSYDGKEGTVEHIDDIGQLHGTWGGLAVIPDVDDFDIITEEALKEAKAKPEADKEKTYNDGLKLAKLHNKPVIYGYENKSYNGKFFALDDPIICNSVSDETKKFKQQYKSCGTVYVAYPDKDFVESLKESAKLSEYWWEDNDPMNQVDQEEENVECGWCGEVFAKSDCKYEQDFGYLCPQCEDALKSRGEQLVFVEPTPKE